MPEAGAAGETPRVAVYLDFDNIVISRYDQVHGRNSFQKDKAQGAGARTADDGHRRRRRHHRLRLVVRHAGAHPGVRRLVGRRQRRLPRPARRPRGRSGAAVPGGGLRQERRRHPAGGRRRRGHVPAARPHPRGDRRRRLRLHRAGAALQAARPLRRRHRRGRCRQPVAGGGVRRVRHLRRAARRPRRSSRRPPKKAAKRRPSGRRGADRRTGAAPTRRPPRPGCWSGRCGSARRRTTPTGCTTRRSRRR